MGVAFGVELTEEQKFELTEGYLEYYGYDKKKSSAHVATDNMFEGTAQQMDAVIELEDPDTGIYKGALDLRKIGFLNSDQEGYLIFTIALPTQDYSMKLLDYLVNIS